jgi:hypothetical protein
MTTAATWVFIFYASIGYDLKIVSGLTAVQCAALLESMKAIRGDPSAKEFRSRLPFPVVCIAPDGQQFESAQAMGVTVPVPRSKRSEGR